MLMKLVIHYLSVNGMTTVMAMTNTIRAFDGSKAHLIEEFLNLETFLLTLILRTLLIQVFQESSRNHFFAELVMHKPRIVLQNFFHNLP